MKRPGRLAIAALLALFLIVLSSFFLSRTADFSRDLRIYIENPADGSICVTNLGAVTIAATVWYQVLTNGTWSPPREELFRLPSSVLLGQGLSIPSGAPKDDTFTSVRYRFKDQANGDAPWRVIVLCQKFYPETLVGQFSYALARYVTHPKKFAPRDHRGPYDTWIYSETFHRTNTVPRSPAPDPRSPSS